MARYAEWNKFIGNLKTDKYGNTTVNEVGIAFEKATADVVPKSEEGAECPTCYGTGRIGTTNWLTKNMTKKQIAEEKAQAIAEHEQHIKTEVAREIFEEIENIFGVHMLWYRFTENQYQSYLELKKKYTESENG